MARKVKRISLGEKSLDRNIASTLVDAISLIVTYAVPVDSTGKIPL